MPDVSRADVVDASALTELVKLPDWAIWSWVGVMFRPPFPNEAHLP